MKKILSLILMLALLSAGCAFAESYSYPEPILFDANITDMVNDKLHYGVAEWMESSESRASFAALIMCDLIAAGVDEEFDFEALLEAGETYVAQVSTDLDGADGTFLDDLVVVFRIKDCDLVVLYFAEEGDIGIYYFMDPGDIEEEIREAGGMREHNECEYYSNESGEVLEALNAVMKDLSVLTES